MFAISAIRRRKPCRYNTKSISIRKHNFSGKHLLLNFTGAKAGTNVVAHSAACATALGRPPVRALRNARPGYAPLLYAGIGSTNGYYTCAARAFLSLARPRAGEGAAQAGSGRRRVGVTTIQLIHKYHASLARLRRSEFITTNTDENAMAADAIIGFNKPLFPNIG